MNYDNTEDKQMFKVIQTLLTIEEYGIHSEHNHFSPMHGLMPFDEIPTRLYREMAAKVKVTEEEDSLFVQYDGMNYRLYEVKYGGYGWSGCKAGEEPATRKQMEFAYKMAVVVERYREQDAIPFPEFSSKREMREFISKQLPTFEKAQKEKDRRQREISKSFRHSGGGKPYRYEEDDYEQFGLDASFFY